MGISSVSGTGDTKQCLVSAACSVHNVWSQPDLTLDPVRNAGAHSRCSGHPLRPLCQRPIHCRLSAWVLCELGHACTHQRVGGRGWDVGAQAPVHDRHRRLRHNNDPHRRLRSRSLAAMEVQPPSMLPEGSVSRVHATDTLEAPRSPEDCTEKRQRRGEAAHTCMPLRPA